jgi:DNA polymerase I
VPSPVVPSGDARTVLGALRDGGVRRGDAVGLAVHPGAGAALVARAARASVPAAAMVGVLREIEVSLRPRWVWWSAEGCASHLVRGGVRPAICWDVAAVHRLLAGGLDDDPGTVWARLHGLDLAAMPRTGQLDLLAASGGVLAAVPPRPAVATDGPGAVALDPSGHLRAEWVGGGWSRDLDRLLAWADLAVRAHDRQRDLLARRASDPSVSGDPLATAYSESAAALLCVELAQDGLPVDRPELESLVRRSVGTRPHDAAEAARQRRERDDAVLRHLDDADGVRVDLRNPAHVRDALARVGLDLPDTRSWRLEPWRDHHPLVGALLGWRKADRIATTYGYDWIDRHVGADDRLRGPWQATDGAAGRMTAGAGLHNLPAELRPGIAAAAGYVLVRADLGQVEQRVLAAISGDRALAAATADPDLYAPVAQRLRVERPVAKVAVLAAMYGQTSGAAGEALKGLQRGYPVAMGFLRSASDVGRAGRAVVTHGGRRVAMWSAEADDEQQRSALAAARGRFARNAVVQGSAAELFKAWAVTVRAGARPLGAQVVLCLHDELLVHAPAEAGQAVAELLHQALDQVAGAWAPGSGVRFVADVSVVHRWSQAKG